MIWEASFIITFAFQSDNNNIAQDAELDFDDRTSNPALSLTIEVSKVEIMIYDHWENTYRVLPRQRPILGFGRIWYQKLNHRWWLDIRLFFITFELDQQPMFIENVIKKNFS